MSFKRAALAFILAAGGVLWGATTVLDFVPLSIEGKATPLVAYRGKVLLIVNVASNSIFTPQYDGIEKLYQKYESQGLVVLAFPSNDFGKEEPAADAEIQKFVAGKYKVTFPLFAKITTEGVHAAPLYQFLTDKETDPKWGGPLHWNFTKFLIDREGKVIERFEPDIEPMGPEMIEAVEKALRAEPAKHDNATARL
ncbi:MAG TPA: glutathione peroxidase [Bryobacteraceae bacterium]|nr:glutathione peroxidase [Bryobacteraceae bacterium]